MFTRIQVIGISGLSISAGVAIGTLSSNIFRNNNVNEGNVIPSVLAKSVIPYDAPAITTSPNRPSEIMRFGFPSMDNIRSFNDFVVSYDRRNRIPNWVFEHLTHERVKPADNVTRESSVFFEDDSIHQYFRATNDDYKGSGYDRGHLAAAGNHRWSQKAMDETFALSNISPQVGKGFNRDAWNTLEKFVRHLTKKFKNVYVCTGPLYLPRREADNKMFVRYEVIGHHHVAVPTHFFKAVLCENDNGDFEQMTFLMENKEQPEKIDLKKYLIDIERVERASGLLIFNNLPKSKIVRINGVKK